MASEPNADVRRSARIQALAVKITKGSCGADAPTIPLPRKSGVGMDTRDDAADLTSEIVSTTFSSHDG